MLRLCIPFEAPTKSNIFPSSYFKYYVRHLSFVFVDFRGCVAVIQFEVFASVDHCPSNINKLPISCPKLYAKCLKSRQCWITVVSVLSVS